jgi:hypothetical protein
MGEKRSAYTALVEGKRPLGKPMRRWEDHVKIYLKEIGWEGSG